MRTATTIASFVLATACVLGYRGDAAIDASYDLADIAAVRIDLPSTPIAIEACDPNAPASCPEVLVVAGRVLSTGGSKADARHNARTPELLFERTDGLGSLRFDVPLAVRGLVDLEIDAIEVPGDRDLDVRTSLGDVSIVGARGAVSVDVDTGDISIEDGDGGVAVHVGNGRIDARTPGNADLVAGTGDVVLVQTGSARDVHATATNGDVRVELADDADLALDVRADGTIRVTTDTIVAIADHELVREVGDATTTVRVRAGGDVTIVRRMP